MILIFQKDNYDKGTNCKRSCALDNYPVARSRLPTVGLDENAGCAGRAVLDPGLCSMGLSRVVPCLVRHRRTDLISVVVCTALCCLWSRHLCHCHAWCDSDSHDER